MARTETDVVTELWKDYENGRKYQDESGLAVNLPKYVDFYEGRQWAKATDKTKNMPRPVFNIVKMICRNKKAAILSAPVRVVYKSDNVGYNADKINKFADFIRKEYGKDAIDKKAIHDGVIKGSYFYHYYWDYEATGKSGIKMGALRCETIDPLNIFFANPRETDEQKQKWILIASRETVDAVKAKADDDVDIGLIVPDESEDRYDKTEQQDSKLVTVLTKYFRQNGEVYCTKATKSVVINKPFALAPDKDAARAQLDGADAPNDNAAEPSKKPVTEYVSARFPLYPIVAGQYEPKENSIFGIGEVEGIIPNQRSINFLIGMMILNVQDTAWGKYIVLPNALKGQEITNEPAQVLVDYTGTGTGIRKLTEQTVQSMPVSLVEEITSLTRTCTGSTEVMSGEVIGSNMSGAAIAQLQSQAQRPIEELRDAFWLVNEKQGRVELQFYKNFYAGADYTYEEADQDGNISNYTDTFFSRDVENVPFAISVETVNGTKSSAAGDINMLDALFAKGAISLETYITAYPDDAISNKSELLRSIKREQEKITTQLQSQVKQYEEQLMQATSLLEKQKETVDNAVACIRENSSLKAMISNLYGEASQKIKAANATIQAANSKISEVEKDASDFAAALYTGGGIDALSEM